MEPNHVSPPRHLLSNHTPLSSHAAAAGQWHMASTAAQTAGTLSHTHTQWFISQLELTVLPQEYLKELRILLFQRALYKLPSRDVFRKGNYYFFFYNNYICFKSLYAHDKVIYVFLQDFLIPFLCDPDLQCILLLLYTRILFFP
jgi:hypothetical protein